MELEKFEGSSLLDDDFIFTAKIGLRAKAVPVLTGPCPESGKGLCINGTGFLLQENSEQHGTVP